MRVAVAGFMHESNTFNPLKADREAFSAQCLKFGPEFLEEWRDAHHEMGGFLEGAGRFGYEPLPIGMAWATPSGPVTDPVFEEVNAEIIARLKQQPCDGLLLALHGAMVAESHLDADGETLRRIREAVGPDLPIVVTFDLHANLSQRMIDHCTAAIGYRTNPHVDQRECGLRAASLLTRIVKKEILRPVQALVKPPVIISLAVQDTSREPLKPWFDLIRNWEAKPPLRAVSFALGFPYADVPQMGPSFLLVADRQRGYEDAQDWAHLMAGHLGKALWEKREQLVADLPSPEEAAARALRAERLPVILVDFGDNVGGGSAGDGTVLLRELLRQGASNAVVCLFDPDAVRHCVHAGVNQAVEFAVGGKVDRLHGEPVQVRGVVRLLHDGTYIEPEVRHGGRRINHMGETALVELEERNLLVLNSLRHPPFSLGQLTCLGIRPKQQRIIVVKAAIAYKAAYAPIAGTIIEVDTPGLTAVNPGRFQYQHIRPMFPLE